MAFPQVVATSTASGAANGSFTINVPGGSASSGDLLIVSIGVDDDGVISSSDFTQLDMFTHGANSCGLYVGYRICTGSEGTTLTLATDSNEAYVGVCYKISAASWDGTEVPDVGTASQGSLNDSPTPPSLTAGWGSDDNLWICAYSNDDGRTTPTAGISGWDNYQDSQNGGPAGVCTAMCTDELAQASVTPGSFTLSDANNNWVAQTVVVRPASSSTQIKIADSSHAHTAAAPAISQSHDIAVSNSTHAHAADAPAITQSHQIFVADSTHAHTAGQPDVSESSSIKISDATHAHAADAPGIGQSHQIQIADSTHAHTAGAPAVTQSHQIQVADSAHAHTAEAPGLSAATDIAIADATHSQTADAPGITQSHQIQIAGATHAHTAEQPGITETGATVIAIADASHAHTASVPFADSYSYWYQTDGQTYCVGLN